MSNVARRRLAVLTILVAALAAAPAAHQSAQRSPVFRSTADAVPLFVTVLDKSGRLVTDLTKDDFQVFDNGKPQPLLGFDATPQPIRLIILADVSGSMADNVPIVAQACLQLVTILEPGDRARAGTFGRAIDISPEFTRDVRALANWLPPGVRSGPTPLWSAVDEAINAFAPVRDEGRRVVLVMSDGKDTGPLGSGQRPLSPSDITERAGRENVMVYGVGMRSALPPGPIPIFSSAGNGSGAAGGTAGASASASSLGSRIADEMTDTLPDPGLSHVAKNTGGGYFELTPRDDLGATFARVMEELHRQYLLAFAPAARDGKIHQIEVKVSRSGVKVRTRKDYLAPKGTAPFPR